MTDLQDSLTGLDNAKLQVADAIKRAERVRAQSAGAGFRGIAHGMTEIVALFKTVHAQVAATVELVQAASVPLTAEVVVSHDIALGRRPGTDGRAPCVKSSGCRTPARSTPTVTCCRPVGIGLWTSTLAAGAFRIRPRGDPARTRTRTDRRNLYPRPTLRRGPPPWPSP